LIASDVQLAMVGILFVLLVGGTVIASVQGCTKAKASVESWALGNGWLVADVRRMPFGGSFWLRKSNSQRVYRVVLSDRAGHRSVADVRCGNWLLGMLSPAIEVKWIEGELVPHPGPPDPTLRQPS
jgi:hypothetical protein